MQLTERQNIYISNKLGSSMLSMSVFEMGSTGETKVSYMKGSIPSFKYHINLFLADII